MREVGGPVYITRYNLYTAAPITGNVAPGASTGDAIQQVNQLSRETLPISMQSEWTEILFMQIRAATPPSTSSPWRWCASSWPGRPLRELVTAAGGDPGGAAVPALFHRRVLFTHNDVNIFVQIGLVVLVGLACKNAILIVEFARQTHLEGKPRFEATVEASRLRLRPILMTSLAFVLGVVPLVVATGAGAEMRRSLGTAGVLRDARGDAVRHLPDARVLLRHPGAGETRLFASGVARRIGSPLSVGCPGSPPASCWRGLLTHARSGRW